ncbi:MAG: inositol monophosphatase [Ignavibacteriaceae bacterium]|nr:inositol monophosphatase [Ignavibacteriaceae bacterium]
MQIEDVKNIALEAGELIRSYFGKKFEVEYKKNESNLVTEVDKASENLIKEFINKKFPSHNILAEEGGRINNNGEYTWVVDPIDGTTNFAHGLPIFSVSIGIQKNDETVLGVVYDVMMDVMYSAEKGSGAFANEKQMFVSNNSNLKHALLVTGFPYDISDNPDNALEKFAALTKASRGMRRLGSAAIDFCYVSKGVFDGFWEVSLHPWDICGGKLIAEEAGGLVTNFKGEQINIYSKQILCTNGKIHNKMIEILCRN